jgi:hypothetical protein
MSRVKPELKGAVAAELTTSFCENLVCEHNADCVGSHRKIRHILIQGGEL